MTCIAPRCAAPRAVGALFCDQHMRAPTGTRGGWISAWRRAQQRGAGVQLDASAVARRLWVGSSPPFDRDLPDFDVMFLCAAEVQPVAVGFSRELVRVPVPDGPLNAYELKRTLIGGKQVAEALQRGQRVLVTCQDGRNRAVLVAGLGLGALTRMTPQQIVRVMRERRHPSALTNPRLVEIMQRALQR